MAQLFFKQGTMNCGKSLDLITTAYNYTSQKKKVLAFTSEVDTRSDFRTIKSRTGYSINANYLPRTEEEIFKIILDSLSEGRVYCILVDESQFLNKEQVISLAKVVDELNIPVICWGLKNDFQNNLFEGSQTLLAYADKIETLKTICYVCDKKATMNLRVLDGFACYTGEQIQVGDEEYLPVCRNCYTNYDSIV